MNDIYLYFSGATDITGNKLKDALKIDGGKTKPKSKKKVIIGYGAKTKESLGFGEGVTVINHPDNIRGNRHKYNSLKTMADAGVNVGPFCSARELRNLLRDPESEIKIPLLGRTNYHQGGKGVWECLGMSHVNNALKEGAGYFRKYLDVIDEYRIHVFNGKCIYAQKKVQRANHAEAFATDNEVKIKAMAEKTGVTLDEATLKHVLKETGKRVTDGKANMVIRSNTRGWRFSRIERPSKALVDMSIAAVEALGLQFGAVDCATVLEDDGSTSVAVMEVNTGPGLEGGTFDAYVAAFKELIEELTSTKKATAKKVTAKKATVTKSKAMTKKEKLAKAIAEAPDEAIDLLQSMFDSMSS